VKVLTQNYASGKLAIIEAPLPLPSSSDVIVKTVASAVSIGTEKSMISVAKKTLVGKALERPDWVLQVKNKIKTEGVAEAYRQSKARLDLSVPLGYSAAGIVVEVGSSVERFSVGDPVVCTGSGYASHADFNCVPERFCEKKPERVGFDEAAFAALGGIALEAIRLAKPELGERVAVIGLGLIGILAVKLLKANGCRVLGIDIDPGKLESAKNWGCDEVINSRADNLRSAVDSFSDGKNMDSVIVLAATKSNDPVKSAANICRERGKIVVAGLVGLEVPRKEFFEKELELSVSRAWGPGAIPSPDSPHPLVTPYPRWPAGENIRAFLDLLEDRAVTVHELISREAAFLDAPAVYAELLGGKAAESGVVLTYEGEENSTALSRLNRVNVNQRPITSTPSNKKTAIGVGLIGAGMYTRGTLLPRLKSLSKVKLVGVASARGLSAAEVAGQYHFDFSTSQYHRLLESDEIELIAILTRHGSHAQLIIECLKAGKHVFVEKPLAINQNQLNEVCKALHDNPQMLVQVGFNRRFAPTTLALKKKFAKINGPLALNISVNAGRLPKTSWVYDDLDGGGRIVGELCHFVDLAAFFTESTVVGVDASHLKTDRYRKDDNVFVTLQFMDGSVATINYFSDGDKSAPRERVEVVGGGAIGTIHDFRKMTFVAGGKRSSSGLLASVDRGTRNILEHTIDVVRGSKIHMNDVSSLFNTTATTFAIQTALDRGNTALVPPLVCD